MNPGFRYTFGKGSGLFPGNKLNVMRVCMKLLLAGGTGNNLLTWSHKKTPCFRGVFVIEYFNSFFPSFYPWPSA